MVLKLANHEQKKDTRVCVRIGGDGGDYDFSKKAKNLKRGGI